MLRRLHAESAGQFWRPEKCEYLEDIDIKTSITCKTWDMFSWLHLVLSVLLNDLLLSLFKNPSKRYISYHDQTQKNEREERNISPKTKEKKE